jgi:hypothetical protein
VDGIGLQHLRPPLHEAAKEATGQAAGAQPGSQEDAVSPLRAGGVIPVLEGFHRETHDRGGVGPPALAQQRLVAVEHPHEEATPPDVPEAGTPQVRRAHAREPQGADGAVHGFPEADAIGELAEPGIQPGREGVVQGLVHDRLLVEPVQGLETSVGHPALGQPRGEEPGSDHLESDPARPHAGEAPQELPPSAKGGGHDDLAVQRVFLGDSAEGVHESVGSQVGIPHEAPVSDGGPGQDRG